MADFARRVAFHEMLASDGSLYMDGKAVCSSLRKKLVHFSHYLQGSMRRNGTVYDIKTNSKQGVYYRLILNKGWIVVFLERIEKSTSNYMPDKIEIILPYFEKIGV